MSVVGRGGAGGEPARPEGLAALAARRERLERRAHVIQAVRAFFHARGFLEVETPLWMRAPLPERYIDAIPCGRGFLATSPEPHMKQLLAAGYERIFQISKCFRAGEAGRLHHPEFTMLEWYRAHAGSAALVEDVQTLVRYVCRKVLGTGELTYQGRRVDVEGAWEYVSVDEAFARYACAELRAEPDQAWFDETLVRQIEPQLGLEVPTIISGYPRAFCPMARALPGVPERADRCEVYIAGVELANGCAEQTDVAEQEAALRREREIRGARGAHVYAWPSAFLAAVPYMPPCAGMALGVDRLVMLLCDAPRISDVMAFCEEWYNSA
ncbi:MAG: EF-P lysine aminoacylase GenX [bacterium]|nr:EF-P lysine aminoacylase GenX [bacterium]